MQLKATLKGFRVILISDLQESPVINLSAKSFAVTVTDWSTQLQASTVIPVTIDYYNLKVSQWEPLIDPWKFSVTVGSSCFVVIYEILIRCRPNVMPRPQL